MSEDAEIRTLPGPTDDSGVPEEQLTEDTDGGQAEAARTVFECPAVPTAYFMDIADPYTGQLGTESALREAGFDVRPLPLDQSPITLKGAIVFGSFSSESPQYKAYMQKYAADLYNFVDRGNVLLQMDQADQTEVNPPFLPTTHVARRGDVDLDKLYKAWNIAYTLHLGDITNNNTPAEWRHAADALSLLDGSVPYAIVPGNHDYGPSGDASDRTTLMNDYILYSKVAAWPTFGGAFQPGKLDNTYHLFSLGKHKMVLLALEWGPRDEVIAWADTVMNRFPDRYGIMVTHAYLNNDDLRYDWKDTAHPQDFDPHFYATPGINDGEELWQKLVRKHKFVMVINGHVLGDGTGYLASKTDSGLTCHQVLANYQFRNLGGECYMRLLELQPDGKTVKVNAFSPLYDSYLPEADQTYSFVLDWPAE